MINQLKIWNNQDLSVDNSLENDTPFALAILLSLASPNEISKKEVSNDVMQFITDLLRRRTTNDYNRVDETIREIYEYILNYKLPLTGNE